MQPSFEQRSNLQQSKGTPHDSCLRHDADPVLWTLAVLRALQAAVGLVSSRSLRLLISSGDREDTAIITPAVGQTRQTLESARKSSLLTLASKDFLRRRLRVCIPHDDERRYSGSGPVGMRRPLVCERHSTPARDTMATNRVERWAGLSADGGAGAGGRILPTQQDVCWCVMHGGHEYRSL